MFNDSQRGSEAGSEALLQVPYAEVYAPISTTQVQEVMGLIERTYQDVSHNVSPDGELFKGAKNGGHELLEFNEAYGEKSALGNMVDILGEAADNPSKIKEAVLGIVHRFEDATRSYHELRAQRRATGDHVKQLRQAKGAKSIYEQTLNGLGQQALVESVKIRVSIPSRASVVR